MRKLFLAVTVMVAPYFAGAQSKTNFIGIALEAGIPTGDFGEAVNPGFGGALRLLFGVSESGQISATTGYTGYKVKSLPAGVKAHYSIVPIMIGYRENLNGFYLEPQLGMGVYGAKASFNGQSDSSSDSAFTWAAGFGYAKNGVDIGVRYQSGKLKDAGSPFSVIGIHIGYNFQLTHI